MVVYVDPHKGFAIGVGTNTCWARRMTAASSKLCVRLTLAITWPQSALGEEDLLAEGAQVNGIVGLPIQKSEEDIHVTRHALPLDHH